MPLPASGSLSTMESDRTHSLRDRITSKPDGHGASPWAVRVLGCHSHTELWSGGLGRGWPQAPTALFMCFLMRK